MINRNNRFMSVSKETIKEILKDKKKVMALISGAILTVTLFTGCGSAKIADKADAVDLISSDSQNVKIVCTDVRDIDLGGYDAGTKGIKIEYTNLSDVSELSNYTELTYLDLSSNLITDVSSLESLENIEVLDLSNNSIDSFNIANYKSLKELRIMGNYNLYTHDLLDYCVAHNIRINISREDVEYVDQIRSMVNSLNLEGLSNEEKEAKIADFVSNHMTYDKAVSYNENLSAEYNVNNLKHAVSGKGVCVNYVTLFNAMCQLSGIHSFEIDGIAKGENHGWSMIEIDGQYMLCDLTWLDQNNILGNMYAKSKFYNATGKKAESFNKSHSETAYAGERVYSDVRSSMATNTEQKSNDVEEFIISLSEQIYEIGANADKETLMKVILSGVAAGSVIVVSKKTKERIDKRKAEKKEQAKSKLEEPDIIFGTKPVKFQEQAIKTDFTPDIQLVVPDEPEKNISEQVPEVTSESKDYFVQAVEEQIAMEIHNQIISKNDKSMEEHIKDASDELHHLLNLSIIERAVYRCNRQGFTNIPLDTKTLDGLDKNTVDIIQATIRMYADIDNLLEEHKKQLQPKSLDDIDDGRTSR